MKTITSLSNQMRIMTKNKNINRKDWRLKKLLEAVNKPLSYEKKTTDKHSTYIDADDLPRY